MPKHAKHESLFIRACFREPTERTPVWIMRQAGRYLPEYRKVREKTTFLNLCKTPELAAQVTLQPIDILKVDAAIIFSDILIIPEAMGMGLTIEEKVGPKLFPTVKTVHDLKRLKRPKVEKAYDSLGRAIQLVRKRLEGKVPLIGFAGSPWTLLVYMVEGGGSRDYAKVKRFIYDQKKTAHQLLKTLSDAVADSLNYQIECGAQAVQIFDSWGGILDPESFQEFSLSYAERVIGRLNRKDVPVIFFAKGTGHQLKRIASCGADVISLDWTVDMAWARKIAKGRVALQGNLDPCLLYCSRSRIRQGVKEVLKKAGKKGHVFNLGHGILPDVPPENARYLVECVKELSS
ncbi:MAG: uroporphyrinogen decarboxylase [bacterium]